MLCSLIDNKIFMKLNLTHNNLFSLNLTNFAECFILNLRDILNHNNCHVKIIFS